MRGIAQGVLLGGLVGLFILPLGARAAPQFILAWGSNGTGPGQFLRPVSVAVNSAREVYVGDLRGRYVQRFSSEGQFLGQCTTGGGGLCPIAIALAIDRADRVIVGDAGEAAVRVYSRDLVPITAWGVPAAYGVAVGQTGDLYVAEGNGCTVSRWRIDGTLLQRWVGGSGAGPGQFSNAWAVAVDASGFVYVADYGNSRVQKFTASGACVRSWGSFGTADGEFMYPSNISVDPTGAILVADPYNNRVEEFTPDGVFRSAWGTPGGGAGQFNEPYGIAIAGAYVFVADASNSRVQKFGDLPTESSQTSWGRLKSLYR